MTGGLITLSVPSSTDLYLVGTPEITFFKIVYRRYINFAIESIKIELDEELKFGEDIEIIVPKAGDCIHKMYLEINIPEVYFTKTDAGIDSEDIITITYDATDENNYNTILNFMKINIKAYRSAINDYNAENSTSTDMLNNMIQIFTDADSQELTNIDAYKLLINTSVANNDIDFINTEYDVVAQNLQNFLPSITKNNILIRVNQTLNNCIKYQQYFFDVYQDYLTYYNNSNNVNLKFAWGEKLGHNIIDYIDLYIGGSKIIRHTGNYLNLLYETSNNKDLDPIYFKMIGNVSSMTSFDKTVKPTYKLVIPFHFWFNERAGNALPISALQHGDVMFKIKLKTLEDCSYVEFIDDVDISLTDMWEDKGYFLNANLLVDYIFLEPEESKKFITHSHEYLIELIDYEDITNITRTDLTVKLNFFNLSKELFWTFQKHEYVNNTTSYNKSLWNNYSLKNNNTGFIMKNCDISFNGFTKLDGKIGTNMYLNYVQPHIKHKNTPIVGINNFCFSLTPEEYQPSGECNFSALNNVALKLNLDSSALTYKLSDIRPDIVVDSSDDETLTTSLNLRFYNVKYNILRFVGGYAGLAFV